MAEILTAEDAKKRYLMWLECEEIIATGHQAYKIADREFTFADLAEVRQMLDKWQAEYERLSAGNRRGPVMRATRIHDRSFQRGRF